MPLSQRSKTPEHTGKITLIDVASLREAAEVFPAGEERVQIDFGAFSDRLVQARRSWQADGWVDAERTVAVASLDLKSEGQQRFADALKRHFIVDVSYYRDNFVSTPPGRHPSEFFDKEKGVRPIISLAPRLAYTIGRLSCSLDPQVLIVSHAFELSYPLLDLANRKAKVALAYFASLLDHRWKLAGLFESESPIRFFDLDPHVTELIGGIDLTKTREAQLSNKREGLGSL
jgi:hypothetical protein